MDTVRVGDVGVVIRLTVTEDGAVKDLSAATSKSLVFTKPSGAQTTKNASFTLTGADGRLQYTTTAASDLNEVGRWRVRARVGGVAGFTGHSTAYEFNVEALT